MCNYQVKMKTMCNYRVLNENKADSAVEQRNGDNIAFVPIITHNIEFLLDQTPPKVGQISDS